MKSFEQNKAQSERETILALREAHRAVSNALDWYGTWSNRHPSWVQEDLVSAERKIRKALEEIDHLENEAHRRVLEELPGIETPRIFISALDE